MSSTSPRQISFAQARYANTSHPMGATVPTTCAVATGLSNDGSLALCFVRVAVPTLACVMLALWAVRSIVMQVEWWQMQRHAAHWDTVPGYATAQEQATALRSKWSSLGGTSATPEVTGKEDGDVHCIICYAALVDHPVELLPCGHQDFCACCLVQLWQLSGVQHRLRCALCRQSVKLICPVRTAGSTPSIDDVVLLQNYNARFGAVQGSPLLDRCVLRLRVMTHASLLPVVIGIRIAVLHATMFVLMLSPASEAPVAGEVLKNTSLYAPTAAAYTRAAHALTTVVYTAATYADDVFLVAVSIILTGHLLQNALFTDLKV